VGSAPPASPATARAERDGAVLTLTVERSRYQAGEQVLADVRIENTSAQPIGWLGGGCEVPAVVLARSGDDVGYFIERMLWERSGGQPVACTANIAERTLGAGEHYALRFVWDATFRSSTIRAAGGRLEVRATFPMGDFRSSDPLDATTEIEIVAVGANSR
ncbi:MAG: hypothetical protein ACRDF0_01655, partial [Candidatus Limnocylindria bacterium]